MKLKPLLLVLVFTMVHIKVLFAQANFTLEHPSSLQNGVYFVECPDESEVFYFFGYSVFAYRTDNGSFENLTHLPKGISLRSSGNTYSAPEPHLGFHLLTDTTWFMVERESIYRTTNSGQNWEVVLTLSPNTIYQSSSWFTDIHFPSENIGYAVGTADKIFKTEDGGNSWNAIQWSSSIEPYRRLSNVKFISDDRGFAMGYEVEDILLNIGVFTPLVYYTEDGGTTWEETLFPESDHHYLDVFFTADDTLFLSLVNRNFIFPFDEVYRSADSGESWQQIELPGLSSLSSCIIRDMHWFSAQEGIILGSMDISNPVNTVYRTSDGGQNWNEISLDQGIAQFFLKVPNLRMIFSGDRGIITGTTGNILISQDAGLSWSSLQKGLPDIYDISVDENEAWAVGYGEYILKKSHTIWEIVSGPSQAPSITGYVDVDHKDKRCVLVDVYGTLYLTDDKGQTWTSRFTQNDMQVRNAVLVDDNILALLYSTTTNSLYLYKENSNGTEEMTTIGSQLLPPAQTAIFSLPENKIVVRTLLNAYIYENDLWSELTSLPSDADTQSLQITRDGFGLIQTTTDYYFITTDSADSWTTMNIDSSVSETFDLGLSIVKGLVRINDTNLLTMLNGFSENNGRAQTFLLHSDDNGSSWNLLEIDIEVEPLVLGNTAFTAFNDNVYIGASNGSIINGDFNQLSLPNQETKGFSVFPNPSTHEVEIISNKEISIIKIFDTLGSLVVSTTNSDVVNVSQLSIGLYILNVTFKDGSSSSKKIIKQ